MYRVGYLQNVIFTERPRVDPVEVAVLPTLPGSFYATLRRVQSGRGCDRAETLHISLGPIFDTNA